MSKRRPVGIVLHDKVDRMYVICDDGTAYSAKVGHPGIVMGWHEIDPIPGSEAADSRGSLPGMGSDPEPAGEDD